MTSLPKVDHIPVPSSAPGGSSYLVNGETYPMHTEARCRTCTHPRRGEVDLWLLDGAPPSTVAQRLGNSAPTTASLLRHSQRHLPRDVIVRKALVAERSRQYGIDLDDQVEEVIDAREMARLLAHAATQALRDGRIVPLTFSDVTKAVDLLVKTEALGEPDHDEELRLLRLAHIRFVEVAQRHAPPEVWDAIGADIRTDRVLAARIERDLGTETPESAALLDRELAALPPT